MLLCVCLRGALAQSALTYGRRWLCAESGRLGVLWRFRTYNAGRRKSGALSKRRCYLEYQYTWPELQERSMQLASSNGVNGTPTIFINGHRIEGVHDTTQLEELISEAKKDRSDEAVAAALHPRWKNDGSR